MGIITREEVVKRLLSPDKMIQETAFMDAKLAVNTLNQFYVSTKFSYDLVLPDIDVQAAHAMYDEIKDFVVSKGYAAGKSFRPYLWTDVNDMGLDPTQPWWGFEFETGYSSLEARKQALTYCWDSYDNVTFDNEGEGQWYSEVTFPPANMKDYLSNETDACGYINYLSDNKELTNNTGYSYVGTHINISTPLMRGGTNERKSFAYIQKVLNRSVGSLDDGELEELFGRATLYAGFFLNNDGKGNYWYEGKVFRTTYDSEVFKKYITVSEGLTKVILYLEQTPDVYFVSNMVDILRDPTTKPVEGSKEEFYASTCCLQPDGGRVMEYECYRDYDESPEEEYEEDMEAAYDNYSEEGYCLCSDCVADRQEQENAA